MRDWSDGGESDELVAKEKRGNQHSPDDLFMAVGVGPNSSFNGSRYENPQEDKAQLSALPRCWLTQNGRAIRRRAWGRVFKLGLVIGYGFTHKTSHSPIIPYSSSSNP